MFKSKKILLIITLVFILSSIAFSIEASTAFKDDFNYINGSFWQKADGYSNGSMFNCTWRAANVTNSNGVTTLKLDRDYSSKPYSGGELRTTNKYGYGYYEVRMKPAKNPGIVSSFFTYTGPTDGTPWDEIDIEFLGKDTTKVQFNYYTNGVGNHEMVYNLGFDASQAFHTYAFEWKRDSITWFVDGRAVHKATQSIPTNPGKIMINLWPGTGVDSWLSPFNGRTPLYAQYDYIKYDSSVSAPPPPPPPSGSTYIDTSAYYSIVNKHSNKGLDVSNVSTANGANVHQWTDYGSANQVWKFIDAGGGYYKIQSKNSGKLLDVYAKSIDNGGNVNQWQDAGGANQLWKPVSVGNGYYKFVNKHSNKVLEVGGFSTSDGANVQQWSDANGANQHWRLVRR